MRKTSKLMKIITKRGHLCTIKKKWDKSKERNKKQPMNVACQPSLSNSALSKIHLTR